MITLSAPAHSLPALLTPTEVAAAARAMGTAGGGTSRLLAVLTDPLAEMEEVLASLHGEPALTARVLKVANSPFYHQAGTVGTLDRAVQVLGLDAIRGICAACCMDRVPLTRARGAPDPQQFRLHSLATAVAAAHLARQLAPARHAEAFIAGLLHDIGLVLLARLRPEAMAQIAGWPDTTPPADMLQLEHQLTGMTHADCAAQLATAWSLPAWLVAAVGGHHGQPPADGGISTAALVQAADLLAHRAGFGLHAACTLADGRPGLGVGASDELLDRLASELPEQVQALAAATAT